MRLLIVFLFSSILTFSQVHLPRLISDGMVLQRNSDLKIWGWASPNEKLSIQFIDSTYHLTTNKNGEWSIVLNKYEAGGPYKMTIKGSNQIIIEDILIGEVWLCSGQSNMELPMRRVKPVYEYEIANSENSNIRYFAVPQKYDFNIPQTELSAGNWQKASPKSISEFSAVAYFFAKDLYETYKIPVGLINASLGGSPAEAWISEESLKKFPVYFEEAQKFKDSALIKKIEDSDKQRMNAWYQLLNEKDIENKTLGPPWRSERYSANDWDTMQIPGYWNTTKLGSVNGVVWFRKEIDVPASMVGKEAKLELGRIVDADSVFINGSFVGTTSYQYPPRWYNINEGVFREGKNIIVVKVISNIGNGGFVPDKNYQIKCGNQTVDLKGVWHYKLGATMEPLAGQTFVRWKPLGLYNAMIHPLINYTIKGVIWYQGESNTKNPKEYKDLMTTLITDWRSKWGIGNIPFLYVQLANYMEDKNSPSESNWAMLRDAQLKTLSVPATGMAVAIDLGEWNDIHPLNKKDVGYRLALAAKNIAYKDLHVVCSGPLYDSYEVVGSKIVISLTNIGSGLMAKGGKELKQFAIAGNDKKYVWANAEIVGDKVIVSNPEVPNPIAVRYAWADNPVGANLYNIEGLPASPFRTDK